MSRAFLSLLSLPLPSSTCPLTENVSNQNRGIRPNSYDAIEEADFRRMLRTSDTVVEASKRFHLLHPHRSYESIRRRHNRLSANYEGILTRKLDGETFVRGGAPFWTTEEQDELAQLLAVSQDDGIAVHRVFQISVSSRRPAFS